MVLAILHSVIFIELELLDAFRVPCECDACLFRLKHISTLEQFPRDHKQMSMTDIRRSQARNEGSSIDSARTREARSGTG